MNNFPVFPPPQGPRRSRRPSLLRRMFHRYDRRKLPFDLLLAALLLLIIAAVLTANAYAQGLSPLQVYLRNGGPVGPDFNGCMIRGEAFEQAAAFRDGGAPPQFTYNSLDAYVQVLGEQWVKRMVNTMYFDSRYANAHGDWLKEQVAVACLDPEGKYTPHMQPLQ